MTLTNGTWKAKPLEAALGYASTGTEQVAVALRLLEGPDSGQVVTWYGYFTDKTIERTFESLRYMGWSSDDLGDLSTVGTMDPYIVLGDEADQQGVVRTRVMWVNDPGGGGVALKDRMNAGDIAAFAQRMKGKAIALGQARAAAPPTTRGGAGAGATGARHTVPGVGGAPAVDDDIPFVLHVDVEHAGEHGAPHA
jgi:hypothetical protein